jgi:hypothetical protein
MILCSHAVTSTLPAKESARRLQRRPGNSAPMPYRDGVTRNAADSPITDALWFEFVSYSGAGSW